MKKIMRTFIVDIDSNTNWHDLLFQYRTSIFMINQTNKKYWKDWILFSIRILFDDMIGEDNNVSTWVTTL